MKRVNSLIDIAKELDELKHGTYVLWSYQSLDIWQGKDNSPISWEKLDIDDIVKLRVFDEDQELHIWRVNTQLYSRMKKDIGDVKAHNIKMKLRGNIAKKAKEHISGLEGDHICIQTRQYYDPNDIGQVGYVDMRFVEFLNGERT